jgi:maleylpyruvate isomerase
LELLREATRRLLVTTSRCDDRDIQAPCRLLGWTNGHLLTHLARNASSHVRRLEAAARGEIVPQYEGGRESRDAEIEAGARRSKDEILEDLTEACAELDVVISSVPDNVWDRAVQREYFTAPAATLPFTRVMEVAVHHTDLGLGYEHTDWPADFTIRALPAVIDRLERRGAATRGSAASWHLHRTDGDGEWLICRTLDGTSITAEHAKADSAIRGPGNGLLAWLMGRGDAQAAGLELLGDAELAVQLPTLYPYG